MMITDVEDYFTKGCGRCARFNTSDCATRKWATGLADLRRICLDLGLSEVVKWGHPCYMHGDRNIAIFGAFRDNYRVSFMNGSLLKDPEGVLQPIGPNSRSKTVLHFSAPDEVSKQEATIRAYLQELMEYADAGIRPQKRTNEDLILADELIDALDADSDLMEAFENLTPGRKRGWNLHFTSAKQSKTRVNRIEKARPRILAGKGWNER